MFVGVRLAVLHCFVIQYKPVIISCYTASSIPWLYALDAKYACMVTMDTSDIIIYSQFLTIDNPEI